MRTDWEARERTRRAEASAIHEEVFEAEEDAIEGSDAEDDYAVLVYEISACAGDGDFEEETGEKEGKDGGDEA